MEEAQVQRKLAATEKAIRDYGRHFVTIQDDGSEDDLSYVKLIDYGKKVRSRRPATVPSFDATRGHLTMTWVVSFWISRPIVMLRAGHHE